MYRVNHVSSLLPQCTPSHAWYLFFLEACLIRSPESLLKHKFPGPIWTYLTNSLRNLQYFVGCHKAWWFLERFRAEVHSCDHPDVPANTVCWGNQPGPRDIMRLHHTCVLSTLSHTSLRCKPRAEKPKDSLIKVNFPKRWFSHIYMSMRYFVTTIWNT